VSLLSYPKYCWSGKTGAGVPSQILNQDGSAESSEMQNGQSPESPANFNQDIIIIQTADCRWNANLNHYKFSIKMVS
jgi:hypothetical protein